MLIKHLRRFNLKIRSTLMAAVAAMAISVGAANATTIHGSYVDIGGLADITQTQHSRTATGSAQVGHGTGWGGHASYGWGFKEVPGLRAEIEGIYLESPVNRVSPGHSGHGHNQNYGGLVNVIYDIDLKDHFGVNAPVTPYVGVGAGYIVNDYHVNGGPRNIGGTQGSFGYQGIVGASFDTGVPGLSAYADYRMLGQTMSRDSYHEGDSHFDHKFNHTFNVGLRYAFNSAPAAVVSDVAYVAPAPSPVRTYLVFFDWDKSTLTAQAKSIVDHAAEESTHVSTTRIEVNGYTDNSSIHGGERGAKFNENLSIKRANAVSAELVAHGVDKSEIDIHGYGETHQLVSTGPNTREPQNRRVEIILH